MRKKLSGKSRDYRDVIVFSKRFTFTSKRKAGVSKFLRFEERLEKLRFRDELVWTMGLTGERNLLFQISPTLCGRCVRTKEKSDANHEPSFLILVLRIKSYIKAISSG